MSMGKRTTQTPYWRKAAPPTPTNVQKANVHINPNNLPTKTNVHAHMHGCTHAHTYAQWMHTHTHTHTPQAYSDRHEQVSRYVSCERKVPVWHIHRRLHSRFISSVKRDSHASQHPLPANMSFCEKVTKWHLTEIQFFFLIRLYSNSAGLFLSSQLYSDKPVACVNVLNAALCAQWPEHLGCFLWHKRTGLITSIKPVVEYFKHKTQICFCFFSISLTYRGCPGSEETGTVWTEWHTVTGRCKKYLFSFSSSEFTSLY